jgi:ABC-type transport system involved in Fe-S cluster assembly fused permease/ATPase subunit
MHLFINILTQKALLLTTGTRSIAMIFRAIVFTFIPTAVELVLVCGLLGRIFQPVVAICVVATFAAYVFWTAQMTKAAAKVPQFYSLLLWDLIT